MILPRITPEPRERIDFACVAMPREFDCGGEWFVGTTWVNEVKLRGCVFQHGTGMSDDHVVTAMDMESGDFVEIDYSVWCGASS